MDTLLTPVGDDILRSKIVMRTDIYTIPGQSTVTNTVAVATNSVYLHKQWIELPPVPAVSVLPLIITNYGMRQLGPWVYTNESRYDNRPFNDSK